MDIVLLIFSLLLILAPIPVFVSVVYIHKLSKEGNSWILTMLDRGSKIKLVGDLIISFFLIYGIGRTVLHWPQLTPGLSTIIIGTALFALETVSVTYALEIRKHRQAALKEQLEDDK